jgi:hypothetical protein
MKRKTRLPMTKAARLARVGATFVAYSSLVAMTALGCKGPKGDDGADASGASENGGDNDNNNNGGGPNGGGPNGGGGSGLVEAPEVSADFVSASGVLVLEPDAGDTSGLQLTEGGAGGEGSLKKLDADGNISPVLKVKKSAGSMMMGSMGSLPKIKTIAVSPLKEIFLHFERPFIYKSQTEPQFLPPPEECMGGMGGKGGPMDGGGEGGEGGPMEGEGSAPMVAALEGGEMSPDGGGEGGGGMDCQSKPNPNYVDPWDMANGFQCQIFKVKGGSINELTGASGASELECLDNEHFIDSWQAQRNSVFQFDDEGNVYFPGSMPNGGGKMVVYKRTADGTVSEVINSNICVQDFLVTGNGGVFYTGSSDCQGGGGSSGGFFRYVAPEGGELREIARDWWNFVFEAAEGAEGDEAVFFGPDPRSATTASWNSACLFRFDPSKGTTAAETIDNEITCGDDINRWVEMRRDEDIKQFGKGFEEPTRIPKAGWKEEFQRRCESAGQVFAGGGSQISAIKQDSTGNIFVIGQVKKKKAGVVTCNLQIKGPHCIDESGNPHLTTEDGYGTRAECLAAGGDFVLGDGRCVVKFTDPGNSSNFRWADLARSSASSCLEVPLGSTDITDLQAQVGANGWDVGPMQWISDRPVFYNSVASPICTDENGVADVHNYLNNVTSSHTTGGTTAVNLNTQVTYGAAKFSNDWWRCMPKSDTGEILSGGGGPDGWLTEYKGMAQVSTDGSKTLELRSSINEQAINLWLVGDVPYYSSYDSAQGRYFLKRYLAESDTTEIVAPDFETYNLTNGDKPGLMYYDGLDFTNNQYSFGTIDKATKEFTKKPGLSGQVKMIVVFPQD